jgi:hypothetical protein
MAETVSTGPSEKDYSGTNNGHNHHGFKGIDTRNPMASLHQDNEPRLPAFGGEFQPGLWRPIEHRRFANPAPLGLCAFALTTFVLSCINMNARGVTAPNVVVPLAYGYGGLVQLLAGMWYVTVLFPVLVHMCLTYSPGKWLWATPLVPPLSHHMAVSGSPGPSSTRRTGTSWAKAGLTTTPRLRQSTRSWRTRWWAFSWRAGSSSRPSCCSARCARPSCFSCSSSPSTSPSSCSPAAILPPTMATRRPPSHFNTPVAASVSLRPSWLGTMPLLVLPTAGTFWFSLTLEAKTK